MAERLGRALQKLLQRFKSASDLTGSLFCEAERGFFVLKRPSQRFGKRKNKKDPNTQGLKKDVVSRRDGFATMGGIRDSA